MLYDVVRIQPWHVLCCFQFGAFDSELNYMSSHFFLPELLASTCPLDYMPYVLHVHTRSRELDGVRDRCVLWRPLRRIILVHYHNWPQSRPLHTLLLAAALYNVCLVAELHWIPCYCSSPVQMRLLSTIYRSTVSWWALYAFNTVAQIAYFVWVIEQ